MSLRTAPELPMSGGIGPRLLMDSTFLLGCPDSEPLELVSGQRDSDPPELVSGSDG